MAFPPEFDSNRNYGNKLDLDKLNVYLEGDGQNPMFFNVDGLPNMLTYGRHYFYISKLNNKSHPYQLKNNTEILFEAKSSNGVLLVSGTSNTNQKNGTATCFIDIEVDPARTYKEVEDGLGTLVLAGTLENKSNTRNPIPISYRDKTNYRCTFPINIRKNVLNGGSPTIISPTHTLETAKGRFSFVKAAYTVPANSGAGMTFNTSGRPDRGGSDPGGGPD